MSKKILITGASGFIGSFLVEEAIKRNYKTFAGIRKGSSTKYLEDPAVNFITLDYSNDESLDTALKTFAAEYGRFDFVIHAAGITKSIRKSDFDLVNFDYTRRFVTALRRNQLVPDKFVYISSLASFGPGVGMEPVTAENTPNPLTCYGNSKLKAEQYLLSHPEFPSVIINPTAVYGPRDKDFYFLLKSIKGHLEMYIDSDKQLLSFVHVQDLSDAIFLAMESKVLHQRLLVSDLNHYTAKAFNQLVKEQLHVKTIRLIIPGFIAGIVASISEVAGKLRGKTPLLNRERLKEFKAKNWSVDCSEIKQLGFDPKFTLERGLEQTIKWYKEQGWI